MIKNVIQASSFKVREATCDLQLISDGRKEMNKIDLQEIFCYSLVWEISDKK